MARPAGSSRFESRRPSTRSSDSAIERPARRCPATRRAVLQRGDALGSCHVRGETHDHDTPTFVRHGVDVVGLEPDHRVVGDRRGMVMGIGPEEDSVIGDAVPDREDRRERPGRCRDSPDRALEARWSQTLVSRQHVVLGTSSIGSCLTSRIGPDHDDRAWRVMHDLVTHRAEDELAGSAEASRPDDDERGVLRCVDDRRRGASCGGLTLDRDG